MERFCALSSDEMQRSAYLYLGSCSIFMAAWIQFNLILCHDYPRENMIGVRSCQIYELKADFKVPLNCVLLN
jgi:hypothetical protein